jgi:hypothetical protein
MPAVVVDMKFISLCAIAFALTATSGLCAADDNPLFADDSILRAVLTAPISQAYAQKYQEVRIYQPGLWSYTVDQGVNQRLQVSIRARGNYRREMCKMPPLQLNFIKSEVKGTLFAGQNKLKLVSPCEPWKSHQEYVVLEYLAYRTLEILTDYSFKTRLVRLSYVDSDQKKAPWTSIGFLIEDDDDMAARLGLEKLKLPQVEFYELDQAKTALAELFMLLIANGDYSVLKGPPGEKCCHNTEIFAAEGAESRVIPIPYDFDMSGLVHASYAAPPENLPIDSVRTRYYKGLCQPPEILAAAIAHVRSKHNEVINLFSNSSQLGKKTKDKTLKYVESFFEILNSGERIDSEIIGRCRGQDHLDAMQRSSADPGDSP